LGIELRIDVRGLEGTALILAKGGVAIGKIVAVLLGRASAACQRRLLDLLSKGLLSNCICSARGC